MAKQDIPTPLEEMLNEWVSKYGLTPEERETLFARTTGFMTLRDLAKLRGVPLATLQAEGLALAKKAGHRRFTPACLALSQEAYRLAEYDREKRDAARGGDEEDCDG